MMFMSIKLYTKKRQLSLGVLGLNIVNLILCIVIFNALIGAL
jgi:hypothetical protein